MILQLYKFIYLYNTKIVIEITLSEFPKYFIAFQKKKKNYWKKLYQQKKSTSALTVSIRWIKLKRSNLSIISRHKKRNKNWCVSKFEKYTQTILYPNGRKI